MWGSSSAGAISKNSTEWPQIDTQCYVHRADPDGILASSERSVRLRRKYLYGVANTPFGGEPQSASTVLFWPVPILYPFEWIPKKHIPLYELNPVAAQVMSLCRILLAGQSADRCDAGQTGRGIGRLFLFGLLVFRRLKPMFYERI